jgi:hypothetical protein
MTTLNIKDALELYKLIGKFVPKDLDENTIILDFIDTIIDNIKKSGELEKFGEVIILMTQKSPDDLKKLNGFELIQLFSDKLVENRIIELISFCKRLSI